MGYGDTKPAAGGGPFRHPPGGGVEGRAAVRCAGVGGQRFLPFTNVELLGGVALVSGCHFLLPGS